MMKTTKLYSAILLLLAALTFSACDKDDEGLSEKQVRNAISAMKGSYFGTLEAQGEDMPERAIAGVPATSDDTLRIRIPLELVAEQLRSWIRPYSVLSTLGYADVRTAYDIVQADNGAVSYVLSPLNVTIPLTTDPAYASAVRTDDIVLAFSDTCGGNYQGGRLKFDLCLTDVIIRGDTVENFRPVVYRYEGSTDFSLTDGRHIQEMEQTLEGKWAAVYSLTSDAKGLGMSTSYVSRSLTYMFDHGTYAKELIETDGSIAQESGTYIVEWGEWGNEHHRLLLTKDGDIFPYISYNIDLTTLSLCLTSSGLPDWQQVFRFCPASNE